MNRLQKKCFIASAGFHMLLLLVLLAGPAFLAKRSAPPHELQLVNMIPTALVDAAVASPGNPNKQIVTAPPPAPVAPQVQPAPPPQPQPRQDPPRPTQVQHNTSAAPHVTEPRKPEISTHLVVRDSSSKPHKTNTQSQSAASQTSDRQANESRQKLAAQFAAAAGNIKAGTSSATVVEEVGRGASGPAMANYAAWVKTVYEREWDLPDETASDDAVTKASVTIARDGSVLSWHILRRSGDAQTDRSVQHTLEKVTFIAPFPEGVTDSQRTYVINFNLKAKRGIG